MSSPGIESLNGRCDQLTRSRFCFSAKTLVTTCSDGLRWYPVAPSHGGMCSLAWLPPPLAVAGSLSAKPRSRLSASHVAVYGQGIYIEYSVEYSKCCALNGILVSTVDACRLLNRCRRPLWPSTPGLAFCLTMWIFGLSGVDSVWRVPYATIIPINRMGEFSRSVE